MTTANFPIPVVSNPNSGTITISPTVTNASNNWITVGSSNTILIQDTIISNWNHTTDYFYPKSAKLSFPEARVIQDNIKEIWNQHTLEDYQNGKKWYREAHEFCLDLGKTYNKDVIVTSAILSALSPNKEWTINKKLADGFFKNGFNRTGHFYRQKTKAKIINEHSKHTLPTIEFIEGVLHGLKTVNFFHCIYNPFEDTHLCIDRHMIKVGIGFDKQKLTLKQYKLLQDEYFIFAKGQNMRPLECQAILWICYKRIKKI